MGNKKLQVWLPLLFAVVLIVGMFLGFGLNPGGSKGFFKTSRNTSLQEALDLIQQHYVDNVNADSIQMGAIQEMMSELDPHSVYFPPVELKEANEELAGNFQGIGVEFNVFNDTVNVLYVLPNGPSDKAGILIGDKILKANGFSLTVKNLPDDSIRKYIRGESGSTVTLQILRQGQLQSLNVTRGNIPVTSIDASYMMNANTGYIKLNKFTSNSYEEFMQALEGLKKQGMKQLIFDLRGNGGGFMDEAIDMADEFLSGEKLIVYTEGAHSKKREYRGKRPGLLEDGKLIVLVDELSASASEVFSGAIQDWDRGTIIGRRTFGKGLVQEQHNLSDGSAIRLTIARYFTPLGRSIQRPYEKGNKKIYMDEIMERYTNGEALYADSNKHNGKEYKTPSGKALYGGGGIMPDIFVPIDTASYPAIINKLVLDGSLNNFVYQYYLKNRTTIDKFASASEFISYYDKPSTIWSEFVTYTKQPGLEKLNDTQRKTLERRLLANLARFRWRNSGYFQVLNAEDMIVKKAVEEITK